MRENSTVSELRSEVREKLKSEGKQTSQVFLWSKEELIKYLESGSIPVTKIKTIENKNLLSLKITRNNGGIDIYLQSDIIPDFFKELQTKSFTSGRCSLDLEGKHFYILTDEKLNTISKIYTLQAYSWNRIESPAIYGDVFNASYFRIVELSEGITLHYDNLPLSEELIKGLSIQIKDVAIELYKQFLKKVKVEVSVTVKELI